jgi:radical SAM superfamily enzyme YgiQ (UPF0313 family)
MPKRILLVSATGDFGLSSWVGRVAQGVRVQKAFIVPLHLATIAGLTPSRYQVQIWDEIVQGPVEENLDRGYDLVGVTAYSSELKRAREIAAAFRARGVPVVIGGAGATAEAEAVHGHFDAVFIGEAELTWPRFLADFDAGRFAAEYRAEGFPALSLSPAPRWDSVVDLLADNYKTGGVQTNRGCPHRCEFCHVWIKYGRAVRTKPIPQVLEEIATLERLGMSRVMFCNDNFIGVPRYAKELLRALIPLNASFRQPLRFNAEITLNVARDEEMLRLLAAAGFNTLFIGIESTNLDNLKAARKKQNTRGGLVEQCRAIAAHGIPVVGSMIVGFDDDTPDVFDAQFRFLQEACIPIPKLNVLKAGKGTDLYDRVRAEGRMVDMARSYPTRVLHNNMMESNIIPRRMTRQQLYRGYLRLLERVSDWGNFTARMLGFLDCIEHLPARPPDPRLEAVAERIRYTMLARPEADPEAIEAIFAAARARAPAMLWDIASMTMIQCYEASQLLEARQALRRQIALEAELEAAGGPAILPPEPLSA